MSQGAAKQFLFDLLALLRGSTMTTAWLLCRDRRFPFSFIASQPTGHGGSIDAEPPSNLGARDRRILKQQTDCFTSLPLDFLVVRKTDVVFVHAVTYPGLRLHVLDSHRRQYRRFF